MGILAGKHGKTTWVKNSARHTGNNQAPQVARVLRAVTEDNSEKEEKS